MPDIANDIIAAIASAISPASAAREALRAGETQKRSELSLALAKARSEAAPLVRDRAELENELRILRSRKGRPLAFDPETGIHCAGEDEAAPRLGETEIVAIRLKPKGLVLFLSAFPQHLL
jgi:hypothetical protein